MVSPSTAGSLVSGCPSVFSGVCSDSTRNAGPGDCGSGVFTGCKVDGVGEKGSRDTTTVDVQTLSKGVFGRPTLGVFSSTAEVVEFLEYRLPD